jgi:hypothetical protein
MHVYVIVRIKYRISGDRFSKWLIVGINSVLGWLHHADVCNADDILETPAASTFRIIE